MPSNRIELPFPLKGISGDSAHGRTPEGMSPDALNVVGYDAAGGRLRGGQRPGMAKFWSTQLGSSNRVQAIASGTSSVQESSTATPYTEDFEAYTPTNWAWSEMAADWDPFDEDAVGAATPLFQTAIIADAGDSAQVAASGGGIASVHFTQSHFLRAAPDRTSRIYTGTNADFVHANGYTVKVNMGDEWTYANRDANRVRVFLRVNPAYNGECYVVRVKQHLNGGTTGVTFKAWLAKGTSTGYTENDSTDESVTYSGDADWRYNEHELYLIVADDGSIQVDVYDKVQAETQTLGTLTGMTDYGGYGRVGFGAYTGFQGTVTIDDFRVDDVPLSEAGYQLRLAAVCNGDVYAARTNQEPTLATSGSGALETNRRIIGATLHHASPTNEPSADNEGHQMIYFADGANWKRLDLHDLEVLAWTEEVGGSLPVDSNSNKPTIIATYRDRVVLSGLPDDPQNWFMSAVADALDFDYGATASATMAVAGNNSNAGVVGDVVTCLAPYSDDIMVMGGDHSLWVMRGDPAARGIIDNISHRTGIAGSKAFAWDTFGNIHFFGAGTHWSMSSNAAEPTPVSRGRMDRLWANVNQSSDDILLAWDVVRKGLHIFVTPHTSGTSTHWFWDQRTDAYWPMQFPNALNPTAVLGYDADKSDDTTLLLGGYDGYVRQFDATQKNDDGTAIDSYVLFTPINPGNSFQNTKLTEAVVVLGSETDSADLTVFSGDHPEAALGLTKSHFVRSLASGRNVVRQRASGNTLVLRVRNNTISETWALEALEVALAAGGRTRKGSL
jgi:hypothetical protein